MNSPRSASRDEEDRNLLARLEEAARGLGFKVRTERGSFRSGRCRSRDEQLIILNRRLGPFERAQVVARILAGEDLDQAWLLPAVREQIARLAEARPDGAGADKADEQEAPW
jgi:hypothetical protein